MSRWGVERISKGRCHNCTWETIEVTTHLHKRLLDIAVDGIFHLGNHACRLGGDLGLLVSAAVFIIW